MSVTRSHSLSVGIVGLPNAGKSTLFNSLTKNSVVAENYPFSTIDKNLGVVEVPDERLARLAAMYNAEKIVPSVIKFVDIAGLVKGASEGEGLGNQFLSHIREVDMIMYVLRAFESNTITHVYERVDPWDDFQIVQTELILKDLDTVQKRMGEVEKRMRVGGDKGIQIAHSALTKIMTAFGDGIPAIEVDLTEDEAEYIDDLWLLSNKPRMFILNVKADDAESPHLSRFKEKVPQEHLLEVDVKIVGEISEMSEEEKEELYQLLPTKPTGVEQIIERAFERLNLITFYTGSQKECNAWAIVEGASVKDAAGVIHTDLAQNFITADVVNVDELIELGGFHPAKEAGKARNQGKEYKVQDGDYILIYSH